MFTNQNIYLLTTYNFTNKLFKKPRIKDDNLKEKINIDEFIIIEFNCVKIVFISIKKRKIRRKIKSKPFIIKNGHVKRGCLLRLLG